MSTVSVGGGGTTNGIPNPVTVSTGFNSGLPIDQLVSEITQIDGEPITQLQQNEQTLQTKQSVYAQVQSYVQSLETSIQALTTRDVATGASIFDNMATTTSNSSIATATASNTAAAQNITLEVQKLPSLTVATSTDDVGAFSDSTTVDQLGITAGNFTIYDNGTPHTIAVSSGESIGQVLTNISTAVPDIPSQPTISDGKIDLGYNTGQQIVLGSGGDSSNFLSITHLLTGVNTDNGTSGNIVASQRNSTLDRNQTLSSAAANTATAITDGTFTINGVSFDTTGKTMNDIIDAINNSSANVTASYNDGNGAFSLTSKNPGSTYISMADGTGNFLTAMNLISPTSSTASQSLGQNAQFVLNGTTMYAASTNVDETVTGLTGVTLNLASASPGTTVTIGVQPDTSGIVNAVQTVVNNYNTAITYIDQQTNAQNNMPLAGDSSIIDLRNQIRSLFTTEVGALANTPYDSLQMVGISTGAVGSTAGTATPQLTFDATQLTAALAANATTVKQLFIAQDLGTGTAQDNGFDGVFTQLDHLMTDQPYTDASGNTAYGALYAGTDSTNAGLFAAFQNSSANQITQMNQDISDMQDRLNTKETDLRNQFLAMDQLVGQYKSQGDALTSLVNQMNSNSSSSSSSSA